MRHFYGHIYRDRKTLAASLLLAFVMISGVALTKQAAAQSTNPAQHGRIGPPSLVRPNGLPAAGPHPGAVKPFLPLDPGAYAAAKQLPRSVRTGRRQGVTTPGKVNRQGVVAQQKLAGFPTMSSAEQISLYGSDQAVAPPDTQLAAGPTQLLEMNNNSLSIWSKSGGLLATGDLNSFFPVPSGYGFTDPRVAYDAPTGRWVASGWSLRRPAQDASQVYLAVSLTSDATGSWYGYTLTNVVGVITDQPMLGVSDDKIVISWNDFQASGSFSGSETRVIQKSDVLSGNTASVVIFGPSGMLFPIMPSQSLGPTTTEWLVSNRSSAIAVIAINGTPNQNNVSWTENDLPIGSTFTPPAANQPTGPPISTDDDRLLSAVWRNGVIWTGGNDRCFPAGDGSARSCLRLIQVSTTGTPTISQDFDDGVPGTDLYYPGVTTDTYGDLFIAYSASSLNMYPGAFSVDHAFNAPTNALDNVVAVRPGQGVYHFDNTSNPQRWGDYSAAAVDPSNAANVWVTGEYVASSTNQSDWGTATAMVALGGGLTSAPESTSWGPGRLDVFARGPDSALWHKWYSGGWSGWEWLGGVLASGPGVVAWGPGRVDVFVRGTDNALWHQWYSGGWSGWESLGGVLTSAPEAASWAPGRLDVVARGSDNGLWHKWWDGSRWSGWEAHGGVLNGDPGAVSWSPNRLDIFVRGADNQLWHRWWDGAHWGGWEPLGGFLTSGPGVASWSPGRLDVFVEGSDNGLWHRWWDGSGWSGWEAHGGVLNSDPGAVSWGPNRIDTFVRGADDQLWHRWWDGTRWGGWESLGSM